MPTAIYIKSLELNNIKTFEEVKLDFEKEDGNLSQWTLILGDNGTGKSTLLQCAAWMKPNIPVGQDNGQINLDEIQPKITDEENDVLLRLVRKSKELGTIRAKFIANRSLNKKNHSKEKSCEPEINIKVVRKKLDDFKSSFVTNSDDIFFKQEAVIYAYSASRKTGRLNLNDTQLEDTISSFISEQTILYDAEEILHRINYATLGSNRSEKIKYKNYLNKIKNVLLSVLPDLETVNDILISPPKLFDSRLQEKEVMISTKHGDLIPFNDFSLGYKVTMSLVIDLAWRLINQYADSKNPLSEPAIVIIDEIDLHLHPLWQREIINNLSKHFPKVQFIATAHSPLMVQSMLGANYAVLENSDRGCNIINQPEDVDGWRVDQILTSSFFGLPTSRGIKYESLLKERQIILDKKKQTPADKINLKRINNELQSFPSGETPEEIEDRKTVSELIKKIKENKIKIKV